MDTPETATPENIAHSASLGEETWSDYLRRHLKARGWTRCQMAAFLEMEDVGTLYRWLAGTQTPSRATCKGVRTLLDSGPAGEAMDFLARAVAALQPRTIDHGAGVARKAAPSGGARREPPAPAPSYAGDDGERRQPMPQGNLPRGPVGGAADSPTSPPPPSPAALAAALARRRKP